MIYVKNDKRYTENQLNRMRVANPLQSGFTQLVDIKPIYSKLTQKLQDMGTENGKVVYEIIELTDAEKELAVNSYNERMKEKRKAEYPSIEECINAILDGTVDNINLIRQSIKDKYPKI